MESLSTAATVEGPVGAAVLARVPELVDWLAARYAATPWEGEVEAARAEYDGLRGKVHDDEELYDLHLAGFLEWFALERPLSNAGRAPAEQALHEGAPGLDAEGQQLLRALARGLRSLFEVMQHEAERILLLDLVAGGIWGVSVDWPLAGVRPGDICEARLLPWRGQVRLGPVLCFHPREARPCIHQLVRRAEREGGLTAALVHAVAGMRQRYGRFRNIAIEHIYATSIKEGVWRG